MLCICQSITCNPEKGSIII